MNWSPDFTGHRMYGRLDLPWAKIQQDLVAWADDQTYSNAVVNDNPDWQQRNPQLWAKQFAYREQGYTQHNTQIWKTTNREPKIDFDWEQDICQQLPLDHAVATLTRQDPGQVLPWHADSFYYLQAQFPQDPRPIWRFLVFMQDWKTGHVLQVGDHVHAHWQQGDTLVWPPGTLHLAANVGSEPKWTCNVTGFLVV